MKSISSILNKRDPIACSACSRLVEYRESIRPKRQEHASYWNNPVAPFGDPEGWLLIIGLAPGAHGANRTSLPFCGDGAGILLYGGLYETGFSNQSNPTDYDPELRLTGAIITNTCLCVPPANRPTLEEFKKCRHHLLEIISIPTITHIICIGGDAHGQLQRALGIKGPAFRHGDSYSLGQYVVTDCYHTSTLNQNTGRITMSMVVDVLRKTMTLGGK